MLRLGRIQLARSELLRALDRAEQSPLLYSALAGRWIRGRLTSLRNEVLSETRAYVAALQDEELPTHVTGPPFPGDRREALEESVRCWSESTRIGAALCRALLEGRAAVSIDDLRSIALPALRHRIIMNFEGEAEGVTQDTIVENIVQTLPREAGEA